MYTLTGVHIANLVLNWADMQKGITGNHWTRLFLLLLFFGYEAVVYVASPTENLSYSAHLGGALAGLVFHRYGLLAPRSRFSGRHYSHQQVRPPPSSVVQPLPPPAPDAATAGGLFEPQT